MCVRLAHRRFISMVHITTTGTMRITARVMLPRGIITAPALLRHAIGTPSAITRRAGLMATVRVPAAADSFSTSPLSLYGGGFFCCMDMQTIAARIDA